MNNKFSNAPAWSMGKQYPSISTITTEKKGKIDDDDIAPGPGNYSSSYGIGISPAWRIGKSNRSGLNIGRAPGPGA